MAVISVRQLGKQYRLGLQMHNTLRDQLAALFRRGKRGSAEEFWALKDVNFDVEQGEVVGIIGRNGAGKSTLLKILSQITEPTEGEVRIRGRVASLLEVGTGFHPELSGRENVFLNGAILGMSRREIRAKFDEIVAFAEVEKFIDTPVKHYSSGMYVRLAFAVAAHLDPEILIVDEVLAVGDTAFQKKCLGKMDNVARDGRTVLFVSHNMPAVLSFCQRGVLLGSGRVNSIGEITDVAQKYSEELNAITARKETLETWAARTGTQIAKITDFRITDLNDVLTETIISGGGLRFSIELTAMHGQMPKRIDLGLSIGTTARQTLWVHYSSYEGKLFDMKQDRAWFTCTVPNLPLSPGSYEVRARILADGRESDWPAGPLANIQVTETDFYGTGSPGFDGKAPLLLKAQWNS